jgi:hypothetical protein
VNRPEVPDPIDPPDPDRCRECRAPFNNANTSDSGLCEACMADHYDDEMCADVARRDELLDWEDAR